MKYHKLKTPSGQLVGNRAHIGIFDEIDLVLKPEVPLARRRTARIFMDEYGQVCRNPRPNIRKPDPYRRMLLWGIGICFVLIGIGLYAMYQAVTGGL